MTTGNLPVIDLWNRSVPGPVRISRDRMNDIFNLSRQLVATNRIEILLDSIARHATEMLLVKFSRIITIESDGSLVSQALHVSSQIPLKMQEKLRFSAYDLHEYRRAISSRAPVILRRDDPNIPFRTRQELGLGMIDSLCLVPLRVDGEGLGVLVLGDSWKAGPEHCEDERLSLATLIADQAASAIYRVRLTDRLKENQLETVLGPWAKTIEARDNYTGGHSDRMTELAVQTATHLNCSYDEVQSIRWATLLHDIGKISIPDEILHKPAGLSSIEWDLVKSHPQKGAEIVLMVSNLEHIAVLILAHHEKI